MGKSESIQSLLNLFEILHLTPEKQPSGTQLAINFDACLKWTEHYRIGSRKIANFPIIFFLKKLLFRISI